MKRLPTQFLMLSLLLLMASTAWSEESGHGPQPVTPIEQTLEELRIIRDVCCLRPGIRGLSENIRVKSVVGRFLEHSRIICFGHGHPLPSSFGKVFITSADWIGRNLDWRFEIFIPIKNQKVKEKILNHIMGAYIKDAAHSWKLMSDGTYQPMGKLGKDFSAQDYFMQHPSLSGRMPDL